MAGNKISQISSRKNSATGTISECYETRLCVIDRGYNESHTGFIMGDVVPAILFIP